MEGLFVCDVETFEYLVNMDENQWMYDNIMSEEIDMNEKNENEAGVNEEPVDCSDAFNTSRVFATQDDVLQWARSVAYEIEFEAVTVIMRSYPNTGMRGRTLFLLIGCERSDQYRCRKKEFIRRNTGSWKCRCSFKLREKQVVVGQG
ncbi:hypothetical protein HKD37_16G045442 [Glycine soja]